MRQFGINDLELVAQICPRWNLLTSWMRQVEAFQRTARRLNEQSPPARRVGWSAQRARHSTSFVLQLIIAP